MENKVEWEAPQLITVPMSEVEKNPTIGETISVIFAMS